MVSLATYPQLEWRGRQAILIAEAEQEALRLYGMDLLWLLVRAKYEGEFPQPSKLIERRTKPKGPQTAEEIKQYIVDRLLAIPDDTVIRTAGGGDQNWT